MLRLCSCCSDEDISMGLGRCGFTYSGQDGGDVLDID